jgi:hypothetical protein
VSVRRWVHYYLSVPRKGPIQPDSAVPESAIQKLTVDPLQLMHRWHNHSTLMVRAECS